MWQMGVTNRDAIRANHAVEHVWKKFAAMLDVDFDRTRSSGDADQAPGVEEPEGRRGIPGVRSHF
jgi:hypothetical protein